MKAFLSYVLLAAAVLSVGGCGRDSSKRSAGAGEPDTVASYWTDSTARKGLYVSSDSTQTASWVIRIVSGIWTATCPWRS